MERRVYAVTGVTPEVSAYGMAKYSRSAQSMEESLRELSGQKAAEFLNTFYFQYGHRSIADMAHVSVAIENISVWAAMVVVDEPLWDGQERSTRYQNFRRSRYHTPDGAPSEYTALADKLFQRYLDLSKAAFEAIAAQYPMPDGMESGYYERTIRARAFDVARYWLPLATRTSLGQVTNARVLERQISRLFSHPLPELQAIAAEMRAAVVERKPFNLMAEHLQSAGYSGEEVSAIVDPGPILPTLAKYTAANPYPDKVRQKLRPVVQQYLAQLTPDDSMAVHLTSGVDLFDHACASLLYSVTNLAYRQILDVVRGLSLAEKTDILDQAFQDRGRHDEWLRELQAAPLVFDILMDIGSFRDLNRHRKSPKIMQPLTTRHGADTPDVLRQLGLEAEYSTGMAETYEAINALGQSWDNLQSLYLLPFATRCRTLFQMDLAQAAYMTELRTGSAGHFSYREIAYQMYERVAEQFPAFARYIRVTNPREQFDPFHR